MILFNISPSYYSKVLPPNAINTGTERGFPNQNSGPQFEPQPSDLQCREIGQGAGENQAAEVGSRAKPDRADQVTAMQKQ